MSFHRETEAESPSQLNRVLARARQADQHRQRVLSTKELLTTTRLELGLVGPPRAEPVPGTDVHAATVTNLEGESRASQRNVMQRLRVPRLSLALSQEPEPSWRGIGLQNRWYGVRLPPVTF